MTWIADQVKAAVDDLNAVIDTTPRLHRFRPDELPAGLDALASMLADAAVLQWMVDGEKACRHLAAAGPQPTFLFIYDPALARCTMCAAARDFAMRGTDEDVTCDCCGVTNPDVLYYPLGIVKAYVTVTGGICELCHDRVTT